MSPLPAGQEAHQEATFNPLRLLYRSFDPRGTFTRTELALAYLANALLFLGAWMGALFVSSGAEDEILKALPGPVFVLSFPCFVAASLGASVRRLHDLGRPWWWMLLAFVSCLGLMLLLLYLLVAPSPSDATPEAIRAAWILGVLGFGTINTFAVTVFVRQYREYILPVTLLFLGLLLFHVGWAAVSEWKRRGPRRGGDSVGSRG